MKIGLTSYSMNNYICDGIMSVLEVMRFAKEKGAEHIELVPFGFTLHDDKTGEFNEPLIAEIRRTSEEIGLPLSNYAVLGDLLKEDKDARQAEVERLKRHIDVAAKLGLKTMRHDVSSFRRPLESNTPIAFEREFPIAVETCQQLADYAAQYGITTLVENHGFFINGSDRVIRLTKNDTLLIAEMSATMQGNDVILSVSPKQTDFTYVIERFEKLVKDTATAGKAEITLFGKESKALGSQYKQLTAADMTAVRQSTEDRIEDIRETPNMTIPSGAKVYYVSNSGNDSNNGTSPSTPWKTIAKVNSTNFSRNTYVCFKRDDMWRETLMADKAGVTYTAYGTGEKPIICGSPQNGAEDPNHMV